MSANKCLKYYLFTKHICKNTPLIMIIKNLSKTGFNMTSFELIFSLLNNFSKRYGLFINP